MTRGTPGSTRLGLAGAIAVAVAIGATAIANGSIATIAAATPAQGCAWHKHSKPVIKHLRRHGQRRRVKRVKHWWTCDTQPTVFPPAAALPAQPGPTTPPTEEPQAEVGHLGVKAVEYSYTLSRPEVSAGEVIVELNNQGEDPHNLVLEHEGSEDPALEIPATPSLSQESESFALAPGTYLLYCSLYTHEAKGMEATLVVSGD
ncbi:MAG TPA: plastocyanin/azurin family copper-binding protein [Solirubrobacterales bacterium]|nr:plastocyanin/azurin family copper-binding protein [Solirubrobacterales bacterium]